MVPVTIVRKILITIIVILIVIFLLIICLRPLVINIAQKDMQTVDSNVTTIELGVTPKSSSNKAVISNNNIYINSGGIYNLSGVLMNGTIFIDTADEVTLHLDNVTLVNEVNSLIDNRKSSKLVIELAENSNNIFSDGSNSSSAIKSVGDVYLDGTGQMLVYANNGNGITITRGNLVVDEITLYIVAVADAFNVARDFLINGGTVLAFGNDEIQPASKLSRQNTLIFNFENTFTENTTFSLSDYYYKSLINFVALRDFKTLTISTPDLKEGGYRLLEGITCDAKIKNGVYEECEPHRGTPVKINISDLYMVRDRVNWYGSMANIIVSIYSHN